MILCILSTLLHFILPGVSLYNERIHICFRLKLVYIKHTWCLGSVCIDTSRTHLSFIRVVLKYFLFFLFFFYPMILVVIYPRALVIMYTYLVLLSTVQQNRHADIMQRNNPSRSPYPTIIMLSLSLLYSCSHAFQLKQRHNIIFTFCDQINCSFPKSCFYATGLYIAYSV